MVETDMLMRLDSDDMALPNAVELVEYYYPQIEADESLCALVFRSALMGGVILDITHSKNRQYVTSLPIVSDSTLRAIELKS